MTMDGVSTGGCGAETAPGGPRGVDQSLGDLCSAIACRWAGSTVPNGGGELGVRAHRAGYAHVLEVGGVRLALTSDGIGTKSECAERAGRYDTLGYDLIAMVVDDLVAIGAEPLGFSNIVDADRLDAATVEKMMRGLAEAASSCGVAILGGEIAQLGSRIGGFGRGMHANWCATALGVLPLGREIIDGSAVRPGDRLIVLRSNGWRSNGFSLAREILSNAGEDGWNASPDGTRTWSEIVLAPSRIYAPGIVSLLREGIPVHGIAHITGGGIPGNLPRILRAGPYGADLTSLWPPQEEVVALCKLGNIVAETAYGQWNMGNGMLLAVPPEAADRVVALLEASGYEAKVAGPVIDEAEIRIDATAWHLGRLAFPVAEGGR